MNINKRIVFFLLFIAILYSVPVWAGQGWYLMTPPIKTTSDPTYNDYAKMIDLDTPKNKWIQDDTFEKLDECKSAIVRMYGQYDKNFKDLSNQITQFRFQGKVKDADELEMKAKASFLLKEQYSSAICIATDDPRLKP